MASIPSNLECPSCKETLKPLVLGCEHCEIKVEGPFAFNEFATMSPDDLHFLRIFIHCEGRIRDMEPALGLSYPTIRSRLTDLKNKLASDPTGKDSEPNDVKTVLALLEKGSLTFDQAMALVKKLSRKA